MKFADRILSKLRPAFSREAAFKWFACIAIAFLCGLGNGGMAGIVRALSLRFGCYCSIEHFFRSTAFCAETLLLYWARAVRELAPLFRLGDGRAVLIGDGVKQAHEGSHMPGVKKHSQQSENSSEPSFIYGHLWGGLGILAEAGALSYCIPLSLTIQNGLAEAFGWIGREERTDSHVVQSVRALCEAAQEISGGAVGVLDAYFMSVGAVKMAKEYGTDLIMRAKPSYVGYERPAELQPGEKRKPGRPRKTGESVKLSSVFESDKASFIAAKAVLYGKEETVLIHSKKLLWGKGLNEELLFVFAITGSGQIVLGCTDTEMPAETALELYSRRFSIESAFKALKQTLNCFGAQFWTKAMPKLDRYAKKGALSPLEAVKDPKDQEKILRAVEAAERFAAIACIALGTLQMVSMKYAQAGTVPAMRFVRTAHGSAPSVESVAAGFRALLGLSPDSELFGTFSKLKGLRMKPEEFDLYRLYDIA
ncbi:MAG: hypothetical protein FWG30_07165 [Eubacteriaceae bacterium]|nr:hypothetical protein [Eubacteriaceae bacterium]